MDVASAIGPPLLWGQHITLSPSIGSLCWLQNSGPEDLGLPLQSKCLSGIQMGPERWGGAGASVYGQSLRRRLSISLGKYATVFWAEIYAIFICAYEIQMNARQEKYVSIPSDRWLLTALRAAKITPQLAQQCQKALNNISTRHSVGLFWVPGHTGVRGNRNWRCARKGGNCSPVRWTRTSLVGLQAEYKKQDKTLDWQPAYGNVVGSYQYAETDSEIDFGP